MPIQLILTALSLTILFIALLYPAAVKFGLTDRPDHRKQHKVPTPLIGGLASYLAILVTLLFNEDFFPHQLVYLAASTLLVGVGLVDDYKSLGVKIRLLTQIIAVLVMTEVADLKINDLGYLVGIGSLHLDSLSTIFTVFAVVGGINAFNMIDGIDGLAGGLSLVSVVAIAFMAWLFGNAQLLNFCLLMAAVITGFLLFNLRIFGRKSAVVFLGDTGSTLFGFTISWLAIYATQCAQPLMPPALVLWIIAIPLIDSVCIMVRRMSKGRSPFAADREHLHHILSLAGYTINQVVARLLVVAWILVCIGTSITLNLAFPDELLLILFIMLFAGYIWCMNHAWAMMKIARYIRTNHSVNARSGDRRKGERRTSNQPVAVERRALEVRRVTPDRRYIPSEAELMKIYSRERLLKIEKSVM